MQAPTENSEEIPQAVAIQASIPGPTTSERLVALMEVVLCSDYPTQIVLGGILFVLGVSPTTADGALSLRYVVALSLTDTVALVGIIVLFLRAHQESPRTLLLGGRPIGREIAVGISLILAAFVVAAGVLGIILQFFPQLHTIPENPLKSLMRTPADAALFALVAVVAGGIREEIQRAFLMNRFERWLGGSRIGIVVTSIAFGAGHITQGVDATVATAALGAFWAFVYVRRRSAIAPMVSHSGFNLLQLVQFVVVGR